MILTKFHWPNGCEMYNEKKCLENLPRSRKFREFGGFSLIELMVTIAIAAILLAVAVPQLVRQIEQSQFTNTSNELLGAVNFARAEALRRVRPVTIAPITGVSWNTGWQMFLDVNRNGAIDGAAVLKRGDAITAAQLTGTADFITFDSNGRRWSNAADAFVEISSFKAGAAVQLERTVCVGRSGRSAIVKGALPCG